MINISQLRKNSEEFKKLISKKSAKVDLEAFLELDEKWRALNSQVEELRQQRNIAAKDRDIDKGKEIKEKLESLESELNDLNNQLKDIILEIPNPPLDNVPEGDESQNIIIKTVGEPTKFNFEVKDHLSIGERLDIIDMTRASKVSGSRFAYLKNQGVILELALVRFAMDKLIPNGFSPVIPPVLIRKNLTEKLGYWHGGGNENYYLVSDYLQEQPKSEKQENPLYLVGTGEHSVVPMHMDETFKAEELPKKYVAFSSCFRREAGTYGKDTKGILRVHQFDKVEMVAFVKPEDDERVRKEMLTHAEELLQELGLPYQVVQLAAEDLGFPSAETIDLETWIPSQDKYRETHSISTTTDFQSRRLNIRYLSGQSEFVHILNGTALAIGRIIIAILENYQQEDGSVLIPDVLRKYTGFEKISSI